MYAIVGSGEYLAPMEAVDRELLGLLGPDPKVVCIPAAAGREGDAMIDDWMHRGVNHFRSLGVDAEGARVWDHATANNADLAATVRAADLVYLSGGKPGYLHSVLESSSVWDAIIDVTSRGGLLVGCSAGAMIQGDTFRGMATSSSGFGLWPGVQVIPHFDEIPAPIASTMRLAAGKGTTVIGVNGNTAMVSAGGTYRVVGEQVTIWSRAGKHTFGPGEVPAELLYP
ncbi:MAG: Type 1 glutamine amidotransferase-like domain-containing protein [Ilumatobacter sp.]